MADNIRMDSHKLIYHPETVTRWLKGENIYPIEVEISPSGGCNHRCIFCAVDYMEYKPAFLEKEILMRDVRHMHEKGLKSIVCAGEGEPLLNRNLPDIVNEIKGMGVDVAMSSNGALLAPEITRDCLAAFTWVRFSVASFNDNAYKEIHRCNNSDLQRVKDNIAYAVEYKNKNGLKTTLGVQCILIPQSMPYIQNMAKELGNMGVDYFTIKHYSPHLDRDNQFDIEYRASLELEHELKQYETEKYKIFFRADAMRRVHTERRYDKCYGLPFMTYIDAHGNVWPCVAHIGCDKYKYGNIYEQTFEEIWEGEQKRKVIELLDGSDINKICRKSCRMDVINQYLYELKHPEGHVNFI